MTSFYFHIKFFVSSLYFIGALCSQLTLLPDTSQIIKKPGDDLAVTCSEKDGNSSSSNIRWMKEPSIIIHNSSKRINAQWTKFNQAPALRLFLTKIEISDSGKYSCTNNNRDKLTFQLIVQEPITFKDTPLVQNGTRGDLAMTIRCEASGSPDPLIKWSAENKELIPNKFEAGGDGLIIRNLSPKDAGVYICLAMQDGIDTFATESIQVNVLYAPEFLEKDDSSVVYLVKNRYSALSCKAEGFPNPTVSWNFNNNTIDSSDFILNVTEYGKYSCTVSNKLGNITRCFSVLEGFLPGRPKNAKAVNSSKNTLELDFIPPKPSPLHNVTGYSVELQEKTGKRNHQIKLHHEPPYVITNLRPDTTYLIRLKAENKVGFGEYSLQVEAKTSNALRLSMNFCLAIVLLFTLKLH